MLLLLAACRGGDTAVQTDIAPQPTAQEAVSISLHETAPTAEPVPTQVPWTDEEVEAIALTLAGECYDDKTHDKRLVCEVILNRVSDGGFGADIISVVSAPNQFDGYWKQSRDISENDREVAIEALEDWYANGCEALSGYLFFEAGDNRENEFREEF